MLLPVFKGIAYTSVFRTIITSFLFMVSNNFFLIYFSGAIGSHFHDEYNQYSYYQNRPLSPRPLDAMTDLTNDLGVCVLRVCSN